MNFRYCPKCKAKLLKPRKRGDERMLDCKKCGFCFYFSPSLGAEVVLADEKGRVLLVRRAFAPQKGYWDNPGGFVEFDETAEQAIRREVKEELGIIIGAINYLGLYTDRYYFKGINYHTLAIAFYGFIKAKKFYPADDVSEAKFFALDNLPTDRFCSSRLTRVFRDYKNLKQVR